MNVADIVERHARERAFAPALLTEQFAIAYGALDQMVWRLAQRFARMELPPDAALALSFRSQALHLIASLAAFRAGIAHVSLASSTPETVGRETIRRTRAAAVIGDDAQLASRFGAGVVAVDLEELSKDRSAIDRGVRREEADAPVLYSPGSGTTGAPRVICYTTRGLLGLLAREVAVWPVRRDERHLMLSPFDFFTAKRRTLGFLAGGGVVVFVNRGASIFDACDRLAVDHLSLVVPQARQLLRSLSERRAGEPRLPRLRSLIVGASPVSQSLRQELRSVLSANTWVGYGANEFGQAAIATPSIQDLHPGSVGRPCEGVELEVVDNEDRPLPSGTCGLVRLRANGGFSGYLDEPEASARALRGGWFYPGDLGLLTSDGTLVFEGRADDLMIFDGINIYPREIEAVLEQHPAVREASAFPIDSTVRHQVPAAAVEVSSPISEDDLLAFCRERLGVRAPVGVVVTDRLPRNPAGKVIKRELVKALVARHAERARARPA